MEIVSVRPSDETVRRHRASGIWRTHTVVDDVFRWAEETPDAPALFASRGRRELVTLTYRELAERVDRFAAALADLGVGPRDVVAIQLPDWWEALALQLACWRLGGVVASVLPTIRGREVERMLAQVGACVFITVDSWDGYGCASAAAEMAPRLPALRHRVVLGCVVQGDEVDFARFFEAERHPAPATVGTDPDAIAQVLFTSGITGEPKAALHSLNTLYAQQAPKLPSDETKLRRYVPNPLMHVLCLWSAGLSLITGGATLLVDRWEPREVARLVAEIAIEQVLMPPAYLTEFLSAVQEDGVELPALKEITTGGTAVANELVIKTARVLRLPLLVQWGMTEGGLILTSTEDPRTWAVDSIGRAGVGTEVELRRAYPDAPITGVTPGRLMIRGASLCLATVGRDSGPLRVVADHDDGWYDTGDLAVPDGRGGYRMVGRVADRIGAHMIPVADVEDALRAHPAITDVAVVAVVGQSDSLEGCAVLVSTALVTLDDVHSHLSDLEMTEWYWPTRVERIDALPRDHMGKVEKARVRRWLFEKDEAPAPAPAPA